MEVEELYSKSQEKYHGNCNCKKFCTTFDDKYNYHHLYASQDLHFRVNHVPRMPRRPKTITIFKNGKFRKYAYFKGFSTLIKKYILSNEISNSSLANYRKAKNKYHLSSGSKSNEEIISKKLHPFRVNLIVNTVTGTEHFYYSANTFGKPCWKIYRCQFNTQEESCCCSCNSDAMFEVMKSLYDCYKKKNCDHCNCILCGHLPKEERRLGEIRKSVPELKAISAVKSKKIKKMKGKKIKDVTSLLKDKSPEEKENILRDLVNAGAILPKGKTKSERELIQKVEAERKIPEEKKISEKILEERIKSEALISKKRIPSAKLRKAKEEGLLTPLEGKTPKQKEKILKGLAMNGIPLPTAKTPSTKKIIDKVRKEMGLPPEPLTAEDKQKYKNAMEMGLITPLEGKSPIEKERILQDLAATGVPLPEARTSSEKALIAKVKEQIPTEIAIKPEKRKPISRSLMEVKTLSDKLRKAKAEGLLTPLEGKTDEQKRKILKELVKNHIPLPEGKTASEKKLIDQVHEEMGLPPQPKTPSTKEKYQEAIKAGLVTPLEGKTASEKEKVLTDLATLGVELPVGRTSSEKALIAKIKENVPVLGEIPVRPERKLTKPGVLPSLRGKTSEEKEQLLKNFAINNIPLPEGKSPSEKVLIDKIRADIGLPPEPKSKSEKGIYKQAQAAGLIVPLEGKTQSEKEKILQGQADLGLELPQGRTASEKSLINKIKKGKKKKVKTRDKGISPPALPPEKRKKLDTKTLKVMKESKGPSDECICGLLTPESERFAPESLPSIKIPSEKLKAAKAAGFLTPLEGKTPSQKEKILKNLAKAGIPLPEPKTASEKKILQKVQNDLGLPPTPLTPSLKEKYAKAQVAGIITPLEGKTPSQKEKILNKQAEMGLNLPVGRTPSEKALIDKIRTGVRTAEIPFEKIRKYSLEGKTPEEKEKILKNLAKTGLPLPEGKTPSEKAIVKKVKEAAGLPIVSPPASERLRKAKAAGLLTPLEGKTPAQKEDLIKRHLAAGIPLPEPKTASEKKIIKDVLAKSSKLLHGKTLSQKEKILKNIAKQGLPLPEPKTASDKAVVDKIRAEATPLKLKQAQAAGLMTPLQGKTNEEKEKILKGLVKAGIPLPEATSPSEKKVFEKVRYDLGLPPEPISLSIKEKMHQAQVAGIITPLEGKTPAQKEKVLKKMHEAGIPLPKGKTKSEKSMIKKIKDEVVSEKLKEAKVKGLITPMEGKTPEQKEKILRKLAKSDMPLPEGKTPSEKALIAKIKAEEGIVPKLRPPELPEKIKKLDKKTAKIMKEGKGPSDKCICGLLTPKPVSEIVPVQKIPSEKMRKAKAAGLLTPLEGKSPEQKEKILKGFAMREIPLPEPKTPSEKRLHDKVRADLGMIPQPKTPSAKIKYSDAVAAGLIAPLEGKSPSQKEKILKGQAALGIPLPEGRTPSEKALIAKVKATVPVPVGEVLPIKKVPSEKLRRAKAAGLLTPLEDKSPEQKEKILKGLAMHEIPLPEPKTASEKRLHDKVRADLGMTPQPKTPSAKIKYNDAVATGLIVPLEGKSPSQKEKILKGQAALGIPLPEGRTPSEKALIAKVKTAVPVPVGEVLSTKKVPSEKVRKAKAAGLLTPLKDKTPEQKEKILKGLAMHEIPLPEPKTASEKRLHDKVRADLGMTPEPKTPSAKLKYNDAVAAGLIAPLEGKSPSQKEKILKGQAALGLSLPEGRTPSEKALIAKIKAGAPKPEEKRIPVHIIPSEKLRKAKEAGILTPLEGKTPEQKEKFLKELALRGIPLPEPKTASESKVIDKVVAALGMPPQPKTSSEKLKYKQAAAAGLITPLQGKSKPQKEKILRGQAQLGLPLPEGRTTSEKVLIAKIKAKPKSIEKISRPALPHQKLAKLDKKTAKVMKESKKPSDECICDLLTPETERGLKEAASIIKIPSKKLLKAKAVGLLTPLKGKTAKQKEKILKDLAMQGIPLPEATTSSEKKIFAKVRNDIGLPPEPKTSSMKQKYNKAIADNIIVPLEGKTNVEKEQVLRKQVALGLPLPVGRTPSEKALIAKVENEAVPSEKLRKAKAAGLLTPLEGKTPQQKEKILQGLAEAGLPLPEAKTTSEIALIQKIKPKPEVAPKYIATEKEKIKTKSRKVGVPKSKGGIIEEFQDIVKTTTCDKGCGCDKKKIRFKHSYVKIRVTSPDISSLCPCPEECLPGVKGGVFTDNEGIKVTVGRVTCIPSNHSRKLNGNDNYEENYKYCSTLTQSTMFKNCTNKKMFDSKSESDISLSRRSFLYNSDYYLKKNIAFVDSYLCSISACGISSASVQNVLSTDISVNSFESINFLKTTSSVSLTTLPSSVSVWSFSATSHSTSNCSDEESSLMKNYIDNYENIRNILLPRQNKGNISYTSLNTNEYKFATQKEIQIYRASDVNNNVFDNQLNSAHSGSTHIIYVEEIDNKNEIAKLLKKTISETSNLYNSSSLFVIVSSSSDNSSDYCSSTICLDLSETHSIWNPGTSGLHHLRERQKGFKISTRGNGRDLGNNDNLLSPPPRAIAETLVVPKKYDNLLHRNNCKRIASTDTTEDRPCCCEVNNMNNDHRDVRVQRSERIVSEFLKPMILKDVVNQGFSHDYYMLDLPDTSKSSYSSPHHSNRCEPTPVRLCKLAPCSGHNICHDNEQMKKRHYVHRNVSPPTLQFYKSCDCSTDKLKKVFEENAKQLVSIACGDSNVDLRKGCNKMERRRVQMPYEITSEPNKCSSCTSSKSNFQPILARDNKKYSCPCEEHQKMSYMDVYSREFDSTTSNKQNNCQCPDRPQKKKNKNVVCECPEEPELEFDISDWFDEKQLRKMQSDLTQTTSGFKIQIPRKKSDSEVSFEEALRYYAENFENIDDEKCGCKDKSKKKSNARCECQYELPPPVEHAVPINEPFPGIKFRIDGKGTASKGLSGILCFE